MKVGDSKSDVHVLGRKSENVYFIYKTKKFINQVLVENFNLS